MERALRTARALAGPSTAVSGELHPAPTLESALRAQADARVVVAQRSDLGALLEGVGRIDASAGVPAVACVPPGWHTTTVPGPPITVAVDDPGTSRHLLGVALNVAAAHRLPLRVVHAWGLEQPPGGHRPSEAALSRWSHRIVEELGALRERADVFVNLEVHVASPVQALVGHSHESSALLIGARRAVYRTAPGLGLVTRGLLHQTACPVLVVPDTPTSALHPGAVNGNPLGGHP
nr:universal stress protein [Nocardioides sp. zg-DK7169]